MTAPTVEFVTQPLSIVRGLVAAIIETETEFPCLTDFTAGFTPPAVMLDGGGWDALTGCQLAYKIRVNVIAGTPSTPIPVCEEMTRQVWDALRQQNYAADTVPPPGIITFGSTNAREMVACQFTITVTLDPTE